MYILMVMAIWMDPSIHPISLNAALGTYTIRMVCAIMCLWKRVAKFCWKFLMRKWFFVSNNTQDALVHTHAAHTAGWSERKNNGDSSTEFANANTRNWAHNAREEKWRETERAEKKGGQLCGILLGTGCWNSATELLIYWYDYTTN